MNGAVHAFSTIKPGTCAVRGCKIEHAVIRVEGLWTNSVSNPDQYVGKHHGDTYRYDGYLVNVHPLDTVPGTVQDAPDEDTPIEFVPVENADKVVPSVFMVCVRWDFAPEMGWRPITQCETEEEAKKCATKWINDKTRGKHEYRVVEYAPVPF